MKHAFFKTLTTLAESDPDIYLLVGDLGYSGIEQFRDKFPDRYINVGICEQNMIGIAAGLAMAGKKPFVFSIIPFHTMRAFEQIRIDVCFHNLPVHIVGAGAGFCYGGLGITHHAIEDVAIMRSLPRMTVLTPADAHETKTLVEQINSLKGPSYLRLGTAEPCRSAEESSKVKLGKIADVVPNDEVVILASGHILPLGLAVQQELAKLGIKAGVSSVHTVKPFDEDFLSSKIDSLKAVFTLEEHNIFGGLGEAVSRILCELPSSNKVTFKAFAVNDEYFDFSGSRDYYNECAGLSKLAITNKIVSLLREFNQISCLTNCSGPGTTQP
jgi:transketolase